MNLLFKENYWDQPELKAEFNKFLKRIHGLDLSVWDSLGFWDPLYRPFSYFDGKSLVSNVCVYSMDMTVQGRRRRVAQISAVGTAPEYLRQGLSSELTRLAIEWAEREHDFFFLFADEDARSFYRKRGFRPLVESLWSVIVSGKPARRGAVKLDVKDKEHLALIHRMAIERESVSEVLGVFNDKLFMFWCLSFLGEFIHYIPELNTLVLYERENGLVKVFDIVAPRTPEFSKVYPYISAAGDKTVEFYFVPDRLNLESAGRKRINDDETYVMGEFPFDDECCIFPYTAHA